MKKFGIITILAGVINGFIFIADAFNSTLDLLRWADQPPVEYYFRNWGLIGTDKIEIQVGEANYSNKILKNLRYKHDTYSLDCTGNRGGFLISTSDDTDYHFFNYFSDVYYYSRSERFDTVQDILCKKPNELSLLLSHPSDSLIGIILF